MSKECSKCHALLPFAQFSKGIDSNGLHRWCKACCKVARKARYEAKRSEENQTSMERYRRVMATDPNAYRAYRRAWRQNHLAEVARAWTEWKQRHPERTKESLRRNDHKRRALKRGAKVGRVDFNVVWERDQGMCHLCGLTVERKDVHFDHVIPLARGGSHTMDNVKVSHGLCNRKKGAKLDYPGISPRIGAGIRKLKYGG